MSVDEIVQEIERDRSFYEKSGGGVTLSGGEPLYQPEFTEQILKVCKERAIHTVLDTSGYAEWEILRSILDYTDLVLYDIKHLNSEEHRKLTGKDNRIILENAVRVSKESVPMVLRVAVIPGINDNVENLKSLANFVKSLRLGLRVELLPYHRLNIPKYEALGREYSLADLRQPSKEHMGKIKKSLKALGVEVFIVS